MSSRSSVVVCSDSLSDALAQYEAGWYPSLAAIAEEYPHVSTADLLIACRRHRDALNPRYSEEHYQAVCLEIDAKYGTAAL